ncbi:MAG: hypothetical protein M1814_002877 [Vezdaea aestivalis]|nr:MAG: hypothetical protein M1814_002877 [Vezdaea aestivalis]
MLLRSIHIPRSISYSSVTTLQERLVAQHLAHKRLPSPTADPAPPSSIITWTSEPTYTLGRREHLSTAQISALSSRPLGRAAVLHAPRGGLTTFHGPGQAICFVTVDLRRHSLDVRTYIDLLEDVVIAACERWGVKAGRAEDRGVWVRNDKIAAVGVHARRGITGHGVAVNVGTELGWFDGIEACGLKGKGQTSFEREGVVGVRWDEVGRWIAGEMGRRLEGVDGVENVGMDWDGK